MVKVITNISTIQIWYYSICCYCQFSRLHLYWPLSKYIFSSKVCFLKMFWILPLQCFRSSSCFPLWRSPILQLYMIQNLSSSYLSMFPYHVNCFFFVSSSVLIWSTPVSPSPVHFWLYIVLMFYKVFSVLSFKCV